MTACLFSHCHRVLGHFCKGMRLQAVRFLNIFSHSFFSFSYRSAAVIDLLLGLLALASSSNNRPRSIYHFSNMAPRLSGQNCKFLSFFCLSIPKRNLRTKKTTRHIKACPESLGATERGLFNENPSQKTQFSSSHICHFSEFYVQIQEFLPEQRLLRLIIPQILCMLFIKQSDQPCYMAGIIYSFSCGKNAFLMQIPTMQNLYCNFSKENKTRQLYLALRQI